MSPKVAKISVIRWWVAMTILALIALAVVIGLIRLQALDFDMGFMVPETVYDVDLVQVVEGHGESIRMQTFLPSTDERQIILDERNQSPDFRLTTSFNKGNRLAQWRSDQVTGRRWVTYSYHAVASAVRYEISPSIRIPEPPTTMARQYLDPTEVIQSTAPEIVELARELLPADGSLLGFLRNAFNRVQALDFVPFKGTTDALTTLRLGEASCNGRSRLLAALFRAQGLPTRLVGGLLLRPGVKRTSHQWIHVWINGHWVPFDATNNHFAEIPHNYLELYRGDHILFKHSSDVGFRYHFAIKRQLVPRQEVEQKKQVLGFWAVFTELGIPLELLKTIIMIPLGALVVVIFRNVLGLHTFGTFLPALIAAAARNTGILWGALGFCLVIVLVSSLRKLLARLQLLHSPQLAVLLTSVIGFMLLLSVLGAQYGMTGLAKVSLFPVAILAITSERFAVMEQEEGSRMAWKTMAVTLVVVFFCYITMNSLSLQILMLGFPELLLVVIALDIWLGRWMGLRLTEWLRFRTFLAKTHLGGN